LATEQGGEGSGHPHSQLWLAGTYELLPWSVAT